jgi:hypothetical protein
MSYDLETQSCLFNSYLNDCIYMTNLSEEKYITIIKSKFDNGLCYYILKNDENVYQKIYVEYVYNEVTNEVTVLDEVKIVDINNFYIETPFNIDNDTSYILLKDMDSYIDWFSTIDKNFRLPIVTPR